MAQVAPTVTPCTHADLIAAVSLAYLTDLGHAPSHATLAILLAQIALETGHASKLVAWNLGNYKRGPGPDWCRFETTEWLGTPPAPVQMECDFSAWPDLASAALFFIEGLYTHWPEAWSGAVAGDADVFATGLKMRGYYTAPESAYAAGVKRWQAYYLALLGGDDSPTLPELPTDAEAAALARAGLA